MKKFVVILSTLLLFLFSSCDSFLKHDFAIKNNSSIQVSFKLKNYQDENVYTLNKEQCITLNLYDNPKIDFVDNPRVYFVSGMSEGNIYDMQKYKYEVINTSKYEIILTEKNNLLGEVYGTSVKIPAATENKSITVIEVYTELPKFIGKIRRNCDCEYCSDENGCKINCESNQNCSCKDSCFEEVNLENFLTFIKQ